MRRRFFVDQFGAGVAAIHGRQAAHLAIVLRAQPGQLYELVHDGEVYLGRVTAAGPDSVAFAVVEAAPAAAPAPAVTLGVALFKFDRLEWMLEKATELGVQGVQLLQTRRVDPRLLAVAPRRLDRWRRIVLDAAQQSRRDEVPEILPPEPLAAFLARTAGLRILLAEDASQPPLRDLAAHPPLTLLAGPEGGWVAEERAAARAAGWVEACLGPRILRCETAVLAALAQL